MVVQPGFNPPPNPASGTIYLLERDEFIRNYVECILRWYGYVCVEGATFEEISAHILKSGKDRPGLVIAEWPQLRERLEDWTRLLADGRFPVKILGLIDEWEKSKPPPEEVPSIMTLLSKPFSPPELAEHIAKTLA